MSTSKKPDHEKNPHAVALGLLGGLKTSPRKAEAVRKNGRKGGCKRQDGTPTLTQERKDAMRKAGKPIPKRKRKRPAKGRPATSGSFTPKPVIPWEF